MYSVHSRFLVHRSQLFFLNLPYFLLQALILYTVLGATLLHAARP